MAVQLWSGTSGAVMVERIFWTLTALSGFTVLVLVVLVLTFCVRFRSGSAVARSPAPKRTTWVEIGCIAMTLGAFLTVAAWANIDFYQIRAAPPDAYTVYVVGKQWMWKIEHPSGRREVDELHVPVGEPVRLVLASDDVIHSFFLPDFRIKQDAVPGRYTSLWFVAEAPGEHRIYCAEYCGAEHSGMTGRLVAMPRAEFDRWLSDRPIEDKTPGTPGTPSAPLARGESVFYRYGCSACHVQTGSVLAPRLDGLWGRPTKLDNGREIIVDENYIRESVYVPNAKVVAGYKAPSVMPSYVGVIDEADLASIIEYIKSIRYGWGHSRAEGAP